MSYARVIEIEARLHCDTCGGDPYLLYRRQMAPESPIYENVLWPNGSGVPPMENPERPTCPNCRKDLRRVPA